MKLIVGLGNPGRLYIDSRHNIGFQVVKALAKDYKILLKKDKRISSLSGQGKIEGQGVALALPLTFMNLSGVAVGALLEKYKIHLDDLLVVSDDLDLEFGRLKIRSRGSAAGHRGLESIIDYIKSQDFCRLRIGIDRPHKNTDPAEYVLSPFTRKEKAQVQDLIERALDCCRLWITEGAAESMNRFNKRSKNE
jgi:PTH1 family peptidyl-tRNA hydrolase